MEYRLGAYYVMVPWVHFAWVTSSGTRQSNDNTIIYRPLCLVNKITSSPFIGFLEAGSPPSMPSWANCMTLTLNLLGSNTWTVGLPCFSLGGTFSLQSTPRSTVSSHLTFWPQRKDVNEHWPFTFETSHLCIKDGSRWYLPPHGCPIAPSHLSNWHNHSENTVIIRII